MATLHRHARIHAVILIDLDHQRYRWRRRSQFARCPLSSVFSIFSWIQPMTDLSAFPITQKWPAQYPEWIQLYSLPTPNGVKVSIMLEEIGLPYEPHRVGFDSNDQ